MTNRVYPNGLKELLKGNLDFDSHAILLALLSGAIYDPSHTAYSDIQGYEITGAGYTLGGKQLSSPTVVSNGDQIYVSCADLVWSTSNIQATHAVLYDDDTGALIAMCEFGGVRSSDEGGDFAFRFEAPVIQIRPA